MIDRPGLRAAALCACLAASWLPAHAQQAQFREVSSAAAVLYDGPSERSRKMFIVVQGTPLEMLSSVNQWAKVRDASGDVLWAQRADLGEARHVVASTLAAVRRAPQANAELVVQIERGVLLEVLEASAPAGWLRVRHRDGASGFVSVSEVWGR